MNEFGCRLQSARKRSNYSQEEMARSIGVTRSAYSSYETGKREPGLDALRIISEKLEVSIDYLLGLTDDPTEQIDLGVFAAHSAVPLDELTEQQKDEIRNFILFTYSKSLKTDH